MGDKDESKDKATDKNTDKSAGKGTEKDNDKSAGKKIDKFAAVLTEQEQEEVRIARSYLRRYRDKQ
ncbi:hypothetical protein HI914_02326 [Erysiphe necator]|nr:hypothetical protein HI914_02326 [Erysiphe necator]